MSAINPLNGVFLGVVPYPAAAVARMFLQADDVPRIRLDDLLNVVSGVGEPERSAGVVLVAGIVGLGRIAVGIFGNRTTAVIEMHHLQRRNVGGRDHFRQVLDGVLGKAVADEENAQRRLHIVVAARTARTRTDQVGNVVRVDRIGGLLHAQITHLLVLAVRIVNRGSAVVNPDLAARDAVDPVGRIGAVAEEHAAVGVVGDDLAVIGAAAERVGRMVGQTEQTAAAGAARRDEIAVVDAGR